MKKRALRLQLKIEKKQIYKGSFNGKYYWCDDRTYNTI